MRGHFIVRAKYASLVVAILLLSVLIPRTAWAAQSNSIALKVDAGFGGYFRGNEWTPLLINVSNTGPDFDGVLQVTSSGTNGLVANDYHAPIQLPTNSSKQVFLNITLLDTANSVTVELANSSGITAKVTQDMKSTLPTDLLYGVITESPRGTIDLVNVHSGIGDAHQVNWQVQNIPGSAAAMRGLDMLVLADVDTGNLTTEQRQTIDDWVVAGGHLVVAGGPNWQKTQAGVMSLLPLKPTSTTTLTSLPSVAAYAGKPGETLEVSPDTPIIVAKGDLTADAQVLIQESGVPILARHEHGGGVVDYLAVDPGIEPYQSWADRNSFWMALVTTTDQQPAWSFGVTDAGLGANAANLIKGLRLPDVFQLCGFLALYIIAVGPLNYLVLKRIGRRELAWLTIPLIIFGCSIISYVTGFSLRGTQATINRMALVQVWPDTNRAEVTGVVGVLAPRRAIYTLDVNDNTTVRELDNNNYSNPATYSISEGNGYAVQSFPVDAGLTAAFTTSGYTQAPSLTSTVVLTMPATQPVNSPNAAVGQPRVTGKVKNTTGMVLTNAVVLGQGGRQEVGTLQPGDEVNFDFYLAPTPVESPPVSPGSAYKSGYFASSIYSNASTYNPSYATRDQTTVDIMGHNYTDLYGRYGLGYGDTPEQQELRREQAFLESLSTSYDPTGGRGADIYLAGWTDSSPIKVDLQGSAFTTEDTSLYIYQLPLTVAPTNTEIELPSTFLNWTPTDNSTRREVSPYNLDVQAGEKIIFRYLPMPPIQFTNVSMIKVTVKAQATNQGIISLWDWTGKQWVDVKATVGTTTVRDAQRFIGPNNAVEMAVEPSSGASLTSYDKIDLTLYGQLASVN